MGHLNLQDQAPLGKVQVMHDTIESSVIPGSPDKLAHILLECGPLFRQFDQVIF